MKAAVIQTLVNLMKIADLVDYLCRHTAGSAYCQLKKVKQQEIDTTKAGYQLKFITIVTEETLGGLRRASSVAVVINFSLC